MYTKDNVIVYSLKNNIGIILMPFMPSIQGVENIQIETSEALQESGALYLTNLVKMSGVANSYNAGKLKAINNLAEIRKFPGFDIAVKSVLWDKDKIIEKYPEVANKYSIKIEVKKEDQNVGNGWIEINGVYVQEDLIKVFESSYKRRKPFIIVGPHGCGKTSSIIAMIEEFKSDKTYSIFSMVSRDVRAFLLGSMSLCSGETKFIFSRFVNTIKKAEDKIIVLDEITRLSPEGQNLLIPLLDPLIKKLEIEEADEIVDVNSDIWFLGSGNIGSAYSGVEEVDSAFTDRCNIVCMDYLPVNLETEVLSKRCEKLKDRQVKSFCHFAESVREEWKNDRIAGTVSTRQLIECGFLMLEGVSFKRSIELLVLPTFRPGDKDIIKQIIQKY